MSSLKYEQRLQRLGWTTLLKRRRRGDAILVYQHLNRNAKLDIEWHRVPTLSQLSGPARAVRSNKDISLEPPLARYAQRNNFFSVRFSDELKQMPALMSCESVNTFKNKYVAWWASESRFPLR